MHLTLAMLAAGAPPLGNDAYVLAEAVGPEFAAVAVTRLPHAPTR